MPRSLIIRSDIHPYHITSRCFDQEFFPLPLAEMWFIMTRHLKRCHNEKRLGIHAFVLMGNHFHLLCHTPLSNIDECMHSFLRGVSVEVSRRSKLQHPLWEGRYRWSLIDSQIHYYQVYRYIFQNPIRARLVQNVQDYPYTTLRKDLPFPIHSNVPMSFGGEEGELIWLNEVYKSEELGLIKLGLRKSQFSVDKRKIKVFTKLSLPDSN